jgi:endonuclease YncB( thermonuclease family)
MLPPPGWYPDAEGPPGQVRYWDGARWTEHRHAYGTAPAPAYAPARRSSKAWVGWLVAGVVAVGAVAAAFDGDGEGSTGSSSAVSADDASGDDAGADAGEPGSADDVSSADAPPSEPAVPADTPTAAAPPNARTYLVVSVTDGDTLRLANGEAVRLVGIDAPEEGECGSLRAAALLTRLVEGQRVTLTAPVDDRDRYDRLLRYVNLGTMDAGLRMIKNGLAIARYDSRDGYDAHPREALYHRTDDTVPDVKCAPASPVPLAGGGCGGYSPCIPSYPPDLDCADVDGPIIVSGSDPHGLDADHDGVACES